MSHLHQRIYIVTMNKYLELQSILILVWHNPIKNMTLQGTEKVKQKREMSITHFFYG